MCTIPTDIDECSTNQGGCSGTCQNTVGSFQCSCSVGFELGPDQMDCVGKRDTNINFVDAKSLHQYP